MSEKPARRRRIRPPNWNFSDQWADENDIHSMPYVTGTVANREAAAIRSDQRSVSRKTDTVANREAAAIRSGADGIEPPTLTVANREAAAIRSCSGRSSGVTGL